VLGIILLSSITIVLEAEPGLGDSHVLQVIEIASVCVFTAEFFIRLATTPSYIRFLMGFLNYIDLLAILPFYLELLITSTGGTVN